MTRYSEVSYTYSGGSKVFTIPFSYLKTEHINVFIDDVEVTDFEFNTTSQIQINDEITSGQVVKIVRTTPIDSRIVNFNDRSVLNAQQQNLDSNQLFNVVQEVYDRNDNFTVSIQTQVDTANTNASAAISTANTANSKADTAVSTANTAETKADNAVSTANSTISIANIASTNATNAVNTANSASSAATAASNKVDEFGQSIETVVEAASKINQLEQSVGEAKAAAQIATSKANETSQTLDEATTSMNQKLANVTEQAELVTQKAQEIVELNPAKTDLSNITEEGIQVIKDNSGLRLENKITNCLLEVPQKIKLELNDGTLTLKAGSQVIVPNGFEADGTTPKFDYVTLQQDLSVHDTYSYNGNVFAIVSANATDIITQRSEVTSSGSTPGYHDTYGTWYDTTENIIKITIDSGATWQGNFAFPIACSSYNNLITSIDQVFNGMGYIGSTVWVDKGVKGLIPNGRNEDGSLKNIEFETSRVLTQTATWVDDNIIFSISPSRIGRWGQNDVYYNEYDNFNYFKGSKITDCFIGTFDYSNCITNFQPKLPFRAVDYNDLEEQLAGKADIDLNNLSTIGQAKFQFAPFSINNGTVANGENKTLYTPTTPIDIDVSWSQPVLSSNGTMGTSAVAITEAVAGRSDAYKVFNGTIDDFGASNWKDLDFRIYVDVGINVSAISLRNGGHYATTGGVFYISDNGIDWTQVGTFSQALSDSSYSTFNVTVTGYHKYYRIFLNQARTYSNGNRHVSCSGIKLTATYQQTIGVGSDLICNPCTVTTADGRTKSFTNTDAINISSYSDGTYYIFKDYSSGALNLESYFEINRTPTTTSTNRIWLDISQNPLQLKKYNGSSWLTINDKVLLGTVTISGGNITAINNAILNSIYNPMWLKSNNTVSNIAPAVVIETYQNGTSGYRIWSDGYCEQWGVSPSGADQETVTVTLLKAFKDTNYNVISVQRDGPSGNYTNGIRVINYGTGSFQLNYRTGGTATAYWRACGYLAAGQY